MDRQPEEVIENGSDVIPWLCVGDEMRNSILHALQWPDGQLRKAC